MDGMAGSFATGTYGTGASLTSAPVSTAAAGSTVRTSTAIPTIAVTTVDTRTGRPTVSAAHAASTKSATATGVASVVGAGNGPGMVASTVGVSMNSTKEAPSSKVKARSTNGGLRNPNPTDRAEMALCDCIFDYLSRVGLRGAADALKTELAAAGHSIKAPLFGTTPQPFLLDWFSLFVDKYTHYARNQLSRTSMDRAAVVSRNGRGPSLPTLANTNRMPNHRPNTPRSQSHPRLNGALADQPFSNLRYSQNPQLVHSSLPPRHTQSHPPSFPLTLEQNPQAVLGLDAAVPPNPVAIAASLGMSSIDAMFNHTTEPSASALKKRPAVPATAAAATSAAVANAVSGAPDRSSRSTPPKTSFVSAASTVKAMEEAKKAGALQDIPQVRGKRAFPQNPRGSSNPVATAAGAFNKAATNTKRQRTTSFPRGIAGTNVADTPIPDHLHRKVGRIMHEKMGVADPTGAAAVPDLTHSGFPPDGLPVQEIPDGVIYLQQNEFKLWPSGSPLPMPSEPMKVQELQIRAEAARKAKNDSVSKNFLLSLQGASGDSGRADVTARAAATAHMPQVSARSQLDANVAARSTAQNHLSALGDRDVASRAKISVTRSTNIAAPSQTASNSGAIARSMELNTGNMGSATGMPMRVEMDDSMSTPSVGQESTGPTMSQRSSGSVGSTGRRGHGSARAGRGSRGRGKGRRPKTSDGGASANAGISTKTSTNNGRSTPKSGGRKSIPKNAPISLKRENENNRVSVGDTLTGSEDQMNSGPVPVSNQQRPGSTPEATRAFADSQLLNIFAPGETTRTGPESSQFDSALGPQQQLPGMTPTPRSGDTGLAYDDIHSYLAPGGGVDVNDLNTMLSLNGGNRMDPNSNFIDDTGILDSTVLDGAADATTLGMGLGRGL